MTQSLFMIYRHIKTRKIIKFCIKKNVLLKSVNIKSYSILILGLFGSIMFTWWLFLFPVKYYYIGFIIGVLQAWNSTKDIKKYFDHISKTINANTITHFCIVEDYKRFLDIKTENMFTKLTMSNDLIKQKIKNKINKYDNNLKESKKDNE